MKSEDKTIEETLHNQTLEIPRSISQLFKHTAIYSVSTSIQRLQGLIMIPIYTNTIYITQLSEYSNYGLVYTFIAFMNFVYLYGMDSAFLRYFFIGDKNRKTVFSTTFYVLVISSIVTTVLILFFSHQIAQYLLFNAHLAQLIQLAGLILIFDTLGNFPFLLLRAEEKPVTFTFFRMIRFSLELLFNILFVVFLKKGVHGILYANILASLLNLLIMLPISFKYLSYKLDKSLLKEMVRFGLPFLPNGIAFMTIEMVDRFLVTKYLGKDILAFYHANYKFAAILLLIIVGFRNAWQPFFLKVAKKYDAAVIYSKVLQYYIFIAGALTVFITFFIRDFLTYRYFNSFYFLGEKYWLGIGIVPWIVLSYFCYGIYTVFTPAFYIKKKSKYMVLFTGSGALINIVSNMILLPKIGIWGAVISTVFAYVVMMISIYFFGQRLYPIPINYFRMVISFLLIGLAYGVYYIANFGFLVRIVVFAVFLYFLWIITLSVLERKNLRNQVLNWTKAKVWSNE